MKSRHLSARMTAVAAGLALASTALGWSAHGHRTITYLALDGLPAEAPSWLKDAPTRNRIAEESNEPDRWRGMQSNALGHENAPDHYIDIEDLANFGLTLQTVSPFRYDFVRDMSVAMHEHPQGVNGPDPSSRAAHYDPKDDPDHTKLWPGFLPHAIQEHYQKLRVSFNTLRILEALNDPARADQVTMARENCVHEMGILSHFVADAAQPLHTTRHHHGWVGTNPENYSTKKEIHSYVDGTIVDLHKLNFKSLRPTMEYTVKVDAKDPWKDMLIYIGRSHDRVEPLYRLERDGELTKEAGKKLISECMMDAGSTLSALYWAAWTSSEPDERQIQAWVKFNNLKPELLPGHEKGGGGAK